MEQAKSILVDVIGAVATITLNSPGTLNAVDTESADSLRRALDAAADMPDVRAVVLRGAGRSFCGGGNVVAMHAAGADLAGFLSRTIDAFHGAVLTLASLPLPVIASVHGAVAGGGISLALACDMVLITRSTRFVTAYAQLGAPCDGGLSFQLARRIGPARALEMMTLHGIVDADRALALGLVNAVVDEATADEEAQRWGRELAALPRQSVIECKRLIATQHLDALREQLAREKAAFLRCGETQDFKSRVAAFADRANRPRKDTPAA